jgi:hypothetical protein
MLNQIACVKTGPHTDASAIRVLDLSRPDGRILASSRAAVQVPILGYTARPPWANATGSEVIGYMLFGGRNSSLLYQVAW